MMLFKFLSLFVFFVSSLSFGESQHRPLGSPERHEISIGSLIHPHYIEGRSLRHLYSLNYSLYFPELHKFFNQTHKHLGQAGLTVGIYTPHLQNSFLARKFFCNSEDEFLLVRGGGKLRISYLEYFIPTLEYGWASFSCDPPSSSTGEIATERRQTHFNFKPYFSVGLDLSLKILDRRSLYNLDGDYGINDMGLGVRCSSLSLTDDSSSQWLCEVGFHLLF